MAWTRNVRPRLSNGLRGTGRTRRTILKKSRVTTRIRYQRPTGQNQKRQLYSVAKQVQRNTRFIRSHKVYTDWQYTDEVPPGPSGWGIRQLTNFGNWNAVLRQSADVAEASRTFVKRMQINFRATLNDADYALYSIFIVTLRKDSAGKDPFVNPPALGTEYIEPASFNGANLRLNSAFYKVHYAAYYTLTKSGLLTTPTGPAATLPAGNPSTTWRKSQCNLDLNMGVRKSTLTGTGDSWPTMEFANLPYYQKYYLMVYATIPTTAGLNPNFSMDAQFVCINTD